MCWTVSNVEHSRWRQYGWHHAFASSHGRASHASRFDLSKRRKNAYAAAVGTYGNYIFEGVPIQGQRLYKILNNIAIYLFDSAVLFPAAFGSLETELPCGTLQGRQSAGSKPHPAPCNSTSTQTPKRTLNISQLDHWRLLKTQLVIFDSAGVKPNDVFDGH